MTFDVVQAVVPIVAVAVGGVVTGTSSYLIFRRQHEDAIAAEDRAQQLRASDARQARAVDATARASDALAKLLALGSEPTLTHMQDQELEAWRRERSSLLILVDVAALDVDASLRERLESACLMMRCYYGPLHAAGQSESQTRYIAARDALECIGAFRRGEDHFPEQSADYINTRGFVDDYIAEMDS